MSAVRRTWPPAAQASEWPEVAQPFFFIAHSDRSGKPRLHQRALVAGLGASMLSEMVLGARVEIDEDLVRPISTYPPTELLARTMFDEVLDGPRRDVAGWLTAWENTIYERVVGRLLTAGLLEMVPRRRILTKYMGYEPVNRTAGAGVEVRLEHVLSSGTWPSAEDGALCGLIAATGLSRKAMWRSQTRERCRQRLDEVVSGLRPSLAVLVDQTQVLLDRAAFAPG